MANKSLWVLPITIDLKTLEPESTDSVEPKKLSIEVPLLGEYVQGDLSNFERTVEKLQNMVKENGFGLKGLGDGGYARTTVAVSALCLPTLALNWVELEVFNCFVLGFFYYDGIAEKLLRANPEEEVKNEILSKFSVIYKKLWKGEYATPGDIPHKIPEFFQAYVIFHHGQTLARKNIPNFVENFKFHQDNITKYVKAHGVMVLPKFSSRLSLESCRFLRAFNVGFPAVLEFAFLVSGMVVKPEIRHHMLYDLIVYLMGIAVSITNDIVSLKKDIIDNIEVNFVRILAKCEGINLVDSVKKSALIIEQLLKDIELARDELLLEFENDAEVEKVVEVMKNVLNGSLSYYSFTNRYGVKIAGVPVKRNI